MHLLRIVTSGSFCVAFVFSRLKKDSKNHRNTSAKHAAFFIPFHHVSDYGRIPSGRIDPLKLLSSHLYITTDNKGRKDCRQEEIMNRRKFFQYALVGTGSTLIAPNALLAAAAAPMAGGLYYTSDAPGRWSKKVSSHLPNIAVEKTQDGAKIQVVTRHGMDDYEHYIIKHIVLDNNYRFINENAFTPGKDKTPESEFTLEKYSGTIYVLSVCNKHDTWLNTAEI
jgi:superoxide reductase